MPISPICGLLSLSTRDVAVLIGSASLCGAIASLVGQAIAPPLTEPPAQFAAGAVGLFAGQWVLRRLRRKERDD